MGWLVLQNAFIKLFKKLEGIARGGLQRVYDIIKNNLYLYKF